MVNRKDIQTMCSCFPQPHYALLYINYKYILFFCQMLQYKSEIITHFLKKIVIFRFLRIF